MTELFLLLLVIVLLICALLAGSVARRARERAGLPEGRVLYSDSGRERRPQEALISLKYGLKGRPDYLVETAEGIVPVEVKSSICPASGRPHDSHVMQLACYCLLVEEATNTPAAYGLIRYRDREVRIEYTTELRDRLLALLAEMQRAKEALTVHRSHAQARRCAGCGFRDVCDEAL